MWQGCNATADTATGSPLLSDLSLQHAIVHNAFAISLSPQVPCLGRSQVTDKTGRHKKFKVEVGDSFDHAPELFSGSAVRHSACIDCLCSEMSDISRTSTRETTALTSWQMRAKCSTCQVCAEVAVSCCPPLELCRQTGRVVGGNSGSGDLASTRRCSFFSNRGEDAFLTSTRLHASAVGERSRCTLL